MSVAIAVLALVLCGGAAWIFNRLVRDRNQVKVAWSDVDVQLQRRHDLVPPLVACVRAYAGHEHTVLTEATQARSAALAPQSLPAREDSEQALGRSLGHLMLLAESYPDLKASANFSQLSTQLVAVEDSLQHARRFYNGSVRQYNTHLQRFPDLLVARALHFRAATFFAAEVQARANVQVVLE
ncbi:MAG TPA: LemA family protein [Rhodanobacteraceae bacterium]|nr:LemA family protein [Rhodanobacteraceae bacterium]